ncbi:MAG TPA: hypothetical protein VF223_18930 [Trebonia sp.]
MTPAAAGRLSQVINRWIYTACLVFGLDLADQQRTCFIYAYSAYQVEYSRNLLFHSDRQMEDVLTPRWTGPGPAWMVPQVTTLFGAKTRPRTVRGHRSPRLEVAVETPAYDLTKFKVHFGNLALKGYTRGERVRSTRVGGIDVNKPRSRAVLAAALALAIAPGGFTVADFAAKVRDMTGQAGYTSRNAAYDLRKLRGKHLADKPSRTRRYLVSPGAARIISALLTLREHVIAPLLAGVADSRIRRTPRHWTDIDRH